MYSKYGGFQRGPPMFPDVPIFYFDPIAPPAFDSGNYYTEGTGTATDNNVEVEVLEDMLVTDDDEEKGDGNGLKAPPLPDWAFSKGGAPSSVPAAKKLIIPARKGPKAETEAPAATGWQAVMIEMQRKKEQIMNKGALKKAPEPVKEKVPPVGQKKKGKKKKGKDFKDVMDELSYKLAKLRGEIEEEDDESDEEIEETPTGKGPVPTKKSAGGDSGTETPETLSMATISPVPGEGPLPMEEQIRTPKASKKVSIAFPSDDGDSPAAAPVRNKLPSKESMMNLLSKVTKTPPAPAAAASEDATLPSISKAKSAPNLLAMLAKRVPPPAQDSTPAPAAPATGSQAKAAIPKPDSVPAPPPVPSAWPPVPHTAVEPPAAAEVEAKPKKQKLVRQTVKKVVTAEAAAGLQPGGTVAKELPDGYYMAAPVIGMVQPRQILAGGTTSPELCTSLQITFRRAAEAQLLNNTNTSMSAADISSSPLPQTPYVKYDLSLALSPFSGVDERKCSFEDGTEDGKDGRDWKNELSPPQNVKDRLTISDLPLPPDFHVAVQRMQNCNAKREAQLEAQRDLELRSFLYYEKPDKNADGTPGSAGKKPEPTVPVEFFSHVGQHLEKKQYSHRKPAGSRAADQDLPLNQRIPAAYKCPANVYQRSSADDLATTYWLSNLRPSINTPAHNNNGAFSSSSGTGATAGKPMSRSHSQNQFLTCSPSLVPPSYRQKTPQQQQQKPSTPQLTVPSSNPSNALAQSFISPIAVTSSLDAASDLSSLDGNQMTPGAKYFMHYRPQTEARAPKLKSDELINRRQSERKQREERQRQKEKEEEEILKQKKERMKMKAMQAAQEAGAYKSNTRYHQHQKIFEKYHMHPDVGHNVERAAKEAYAQYTQKHHLPPTEGDQLYASAQRKAAAATRQHIQEMSRMADLQREFEDYGDSQNRYDFSPNQRNIMHY